MSDSRNHQLSPESHQFLTPAAIYEELSIPRLLTGFYIEDRLFEMQIYLMLLYRSGLSLPVSFQDWQRKSRDLEITDLEWLYKRCQRDDGDLLVQTMIIVKIQWFLMLKEIYKRFAEKPTGLDILMERWKEVERRWVQKRRLKTSSSPQDTTQDGMERGLKLLDAAKMHAMQEQDHQKFLDLPPPAFPLAALMDEFEHNAWNTLVAEMWKPSLEATFKNCLPLIRGDMESSSDAVDNFLREQARKTLRRNIIFDGKEEFPQHGSESWRADWDFSRAASEHRHRSIEKKIHRNHFPDRSAMIEVLRKAQKRWGKKGVIALKAMSEGKTEQEAASLAGITERTLRNYQIKLRKEFSQ